MTERLWEEHLAESLIDEADYMNQDEDDRKDAFDSSLSFGTAGIRGKIGLGPNRLNRFTVEKVAQGLSDYLNETGEKKVVIGHDIRHLSREFSLAMAGVFNGAGIEVIITEDYTTTPELSFFTREYAAAIGIMITASHNPPEYNGIKVYGSDGAQLTDGPAELITGYIGKVRNIFNLHSMDFEDAESRGLVRYVSRDTKDGYRQAVVELTGDIEESALSVVFTSLHGTSVPVVPDILSSLHFDNLHLVEAQTVPHPDFPDAASVNPEDRAAFDGAKMLAEETGADVLIATDPDADRVGIVVRHGGEYLHLNGNQLGAVLLYERLKNVTDESIPVIFKTVVTSDIAKKIGRHFGAEVHEILTGFKYIGEGIRKLEDDPKRRFIMGYEESYGYLLDGFVRDKDAVQLVPYIVKFASRLKNEGRTIVDLLEEIHETFGRQEEIMFSHKFEGLSGKEQMDEIMHQFRNNPPSTVEKRNVIYVEDFMTGQRWFENGETEDISLPKANVVKLHFDDGWIALRPSGTEPKIKLYVSLQSEHIYEEAKIINDMVFGV